MHPKIKPKEEHTASQLKEFQFENAQDASYAIYQLKTKELEDAREEVKAEKAQAPKVDDPERKPSVLQKLCEGKEQVKQSDNQKEKNKDVER